MSVLRDDDAYAREILDARVRSLAIAFPLQGRPKPREVGARRVVAVGGLEGHGRADVRDVGSHGVLPCSFEVPFRVDDLAASRGRLDRGGEVDRLPDRDVDAIAAADGELDDRLQTFPARGVTWDDDLAVLVDLVARARRRRLAAL